MRIKKGSKQIPKTKYYTANKKYFDRLYAHLQINSHLEDKTRYVNDGVINFTQLGQNLAERLDENGKLIPTTRQTISKRFKNLEELGLVQKAEDRYILPELERNQAFLVAPKTLRTLTTLLSPHAVSIYVYLINRYVAASQTPYSFTIGTLKEFCGLSVKTKSNNYIITTILEGLQKLGLIIYHLDKSNPNGQEWKTIYVLDSIPN